MTIGGKMPKLNYVYIFDCVHCSNFYGEQTLTKNGALLCPNCYAEQHIDSPFVEQMEVSYKPKDFTPLASNDEWQRVDKYELYASEAEMLTGMVAQRLDDVNLTASVRKTLESIYYELTKES
jgi:hypothetical protein